MKWKIRYKYESGEWGEPEEKSYLRKFVAKNVAEDNIEVDRGVSDRIRKQGGEPGKSIVDYELIPVDEENVG